MDKENLLQMNNKMCALVNKEQIDIICRKCVQMKTIIENKLCQTEVDIHCMICLVCGS